MLFASVATLFFTFTTATPLFFGYGSTSIDINVGSINGKTKNGIDSFRGVPYAEPPVGDLRLRPPQHIRRNLGKVDATADKARGCPQFYTQINQDNTFLNLFAFIYGSPPVQALLNYGEDCLTVDVIRPANTSPSDKLPVLFWIPGGGFQFGATSEQDGTPLVQKSIALNQPFIYVAVNYRLGAFGFLAGNELADEGSTNLGLKDQRLAMEWVQENIAAFGGDPEKVTIWGQSAGAMSTFDHLIIHDGDNTYKGKPLFRGAVMNSGAMIPVNGVRDAKAQSVFEDIAKAAHCGDAVDKLDCMRKADYTTFLYASSSVPALLSYRTIDVSFAPRPDDSFYPQSPELALAQGKFTKVPIITGCQEDEGTLLAAILTNITTNAELTDYLASFFPGDPDANEHVAGLLEQYHDDPEGGQPFGSPFRTGDQYNIYPQFKRIAAVTGDLLGALQRRRILHYYSGEMPSWSYLSTWLHDTGNLGTYHGSDMPVLYGTSDNSALVDAFQKYYISFVNHLDPNAMGADGAMIPWPQYNNSAPELLNFDVKGQKIISDDFRQDAYDYLIAHESNFRL